MFSPHQLGFTNTTPQLMRPRPHTASTMRGSIVQMKSFTEFLGVFIVFSKSRDRRVVTRHGSEIIRIIILNGKHGEERVCSLNLWINKGGYCKNLVGKYKPSVVDP